MVGHRIAVVAIATTIISGPLAAQDFANQIAARQGQMDILALNLGILGGMARGNIDYDAGAAEAAATNIAAMASLDQSAMWPEGSDSMTFEESRAEPLIWDDMDAFLAKWSALGERAPALIEAAATGMDAIGPALGEFGGACKACHDDFRSPEQ